jgi:alkaline phosphatase
LDSTITDPENQKGRRSDGKDLVESWKETKPTETSKYITGADELLAIDTSKTDYLLGLFAADHMAYNETSVADNDPSLEDMTRVAIEILSRNPNGYFLFVEGGKVNERVMLPLARKRPEGF